MNGETDLALYGNSYRRLRERYRWLKLEDVIAEANAAAIKHRRWLKPEDVAKLFNVPVGLIAGSNFVNAKRQPHLLPHDALLFIKNGPIVGVYPPSMKETKVNDKVVGKIRNRFYIAHPKVTCAIEQAQDNTFTPNCHRSGDLYGRWSKKSLNDALAHAEEHLENNPSVDHVAIVQIIRVVRRRKAPLVVDVIK